MSSIYHTVDSHQSARPPRWWIGYTVAALCLVVGVVLPCGGIVALMYSDQVPGPTFHPPGSVAVPVAEPGRFVAWVEEPDSASSRAELSLPADVLWVVTDPDGKPVVAREAEAGTTSSTMTTERLGAFVFDAQSTGSYTVQVKGSFLAAQSIVVTPDRGGAEVAYGFGALGLLLVGGLLVLGGVSTLIVTIVKHSKHSG
jgi:hypothetical protein